ncbi:acyltransferase [Saccharicrinis sp. 156]|uniref:acyltransferase n=1 Tax=Saccharicrinis sp. 156 TaxID=3417574 RepID=UPI003D34EFCD
MQKIATIIFKVVRRLYTYIRIWLNTLYVNFIFYCNNIQFNKVVSNGIPFINVTLNATCKIGSNFRMNNGMKGNPIGRPQPCIIFVARKGEIIIGNNVSISSTALIAQQQIILEDNVKCGGGVCIYDTDFHSLDSHERNDAAADVNFKKTSPVIIKRNAFIGAHVTILKGVCIGENSIVGAGAVVTKNIPANEIWAGNPARFIKSTKKYEVNN